MDNVPTSSCINHPRYLQLSGVVFIWVPSLACDPTTVKDLQKTPSKVSQQSFSGLPSNHTKLVNKQQQTTLRNKERIPWVGTFCAIFLAEGMMDS
jgi:hypothetical protein